MIKNVFSIYDTQAEAFMNPFQCNTQGEAVRAFTSHVSDPNSQPAKFPHDFVLMHIAKFNDTTGQYLELDNKAPTRVISAIEALNNLKLIEEDKA
jgi:hypothetical protein